MKISKAGQKSQASSAFVSPISVITSLYSLEENENSFIEAAKKGDLEKVGSYLDRQKHEVKVNKMLFSKADGAGEWRLYFLAEAALILAVHEKNHEVVKLILSKGFVIREPHSRSCQCKECSLLGLLLKSLSRLNTYSALASPLYLSFCYLYAVPISFETASGTLPPKTDSGSVSDLEDDTHGDISDVDVFRSRLDPIFRAFELNGKLELFAATEYEFIKEYRQLSNQCEVYAVDLLNLCRNMDEIGCVMSMTSLQNDRPNSATENDAIDLSVLNFAIKNKNERFVAHPYSQLMLNSVLYKGLYSWQYRSFLTKSLFLSLFFVFFPVWSLFYLLTPHNSLSRMLSTPLAKFTGDIISFLWFLVLLTYSSMEDKFGGNTMEISFANLLVTIWVVAFIVKEVKDLYHQGRQRYFSQWWNAVTIIMLGMFVLAGFLWMIGYTALVDETSYMSAQHFSTIFGHVSHQAAFKALLLSSTFYAIAFLLSFVHISNALQVNSTIGPLHLSLVQMCRDLSKFLLLFCVMYIAFVLALRKVYSQYVFITEIYYTNSTLSNVHKFSRFTGGLDDLFWALFDKTDLDAFKIGEKEFMITEVTGEMLFAAYNIIAILIALNMLIAMMANSFQKVADDADIQWKFSRTRMWMQHVDRGSVVSPPFNLIPSWKSILAGLRWLKKRIQEGKSSKYEEIQREEKEHKIEENERRKVIENLIERYFARQEEYTQDTTTTLL